MPRGRRNLGLLAVGVVMALFAGCGNRVPPPNGTFDYQIGGAYPPPDGVSVVSRDRSDRPAEGLYNICYVNGFQAQTEAEQWWRDTHPTLLLRDEAGVPVKDTESDELILDISTPAKRQQLAEIVGRWIDGCGADGFQGVEVDNLDSYTRAGERANGDPRLTEDHAVAYVRLLADRAHRAELALGQKNGAELVPRRGDMSTDFAVVEECNRYDECDVYTAGYGSSVFVVEYRRQDFDLGCRRWPGLSIVLRDREVRPPDEVGYVRDAC